MGEQSSCSKCSTIQVKQRITVTSISVFLVTSVWMCQWIMQRNKIKYDERLELMGTRTHGSLFFSKLYLNASEFTWYYVLIFVILFLISLTFFKGPFTYFARSVFCSLDFFFPQVPLPFALLHCCLLVFFK